MSARSASAGAKGGTIRGWRRGYWLVGGVAAFGLAGFVIAVWYAYNQGVVEGTEIVVPEMAEVVTLNAGLALHLGPLREHAEVLPDPDPRRHAGRVRASLAVGGRPLAVSPPERPPA